MKILWISQMLVSDGRSSIGLTMYLEMPKWLARGGHKILALLGMQPTRLLRRFRPTSERSLRYLPMVNRPFLTTLSFQMCLALALPMILLRFAPDVVIVDYFSVLTVGPLALLHKLGILRCAFVLDVRTLPVDTKGWHGWISERRFDLSLLLGKRLMDGMTVITPRMQETIAKRYAISPSEIGVWESGVDVEKFGEARSRREELGWTDKFVVMYHGTLSPNRGLQAAVAALAQLEQAYSDTSLVLLGAGEATGELQALIVQLGVGDMVKILPPVPYAEVAAYVASADVGIVPLPDIEWWSTSSPLKLMEYLAAGKPVIVSRIAAHTGVIGDNRCAYYLPVVSPEAIADGIRHFHARRNELAYLGGLGQEIVKNGYSWAIQAQRLANYLSNIVSNSPAYADKPGPNKE